MFKIDSVSKKEKQLYLKVTILQQMALSLLLFIPQSFTVLCNNAGELFDLIMV